MAYKLIPQRIQRKRTKGWKMPENTVSVCRPGEFGNPFKIGTWAKIGGTGGFAYLCCWEKQYATPDMTFIEDSIIATEMYIYYLEKYPLSKEKINKLKGKNLACWCKVGDPCHADILLEIVNK